MRTTSGTLGQCEMPQHSNHRSPRRRRSKKKGHEKILEETIIENFPKIGKEISIQVQETQRVQKQGKSKAKHHKTHINQINKDQTQRTNIKSSKGETTNNTQRDSRKDNS